MQSITGGADQSREFRTIPRLSALDLRLKAFARHSFRLCRQALDGQVERVEEGDQLRNRRDAIEASVANVCKELVDLKDVVDLNRRTHRNRADFPVTEVGVEHPKIAVNVVPARQTADVVVQLAITIDAANQCYEAEMRP